MRRSEKLKYKATDLLNGKDFGVIDAELHRNKGIALSLLAGEGFLLEAAPAK